MCVVRTNIVCYFQLLSQAFLFNSCHIHTHTYSQDKETKGKQKHMSIVCRILGEKRKERRGVRQELEYREWNTNVLLNLPLE